MRIFLEDCKERFLEVFKPAQEGEVKKEDIGTITVFIHIGEQTYYVSTCDTMYKEMNSELSRSADNDTLQDKSDRR